MTQILHCANNIHNIYFISYLNNNLSKNNNKICMSMFTSSYRPTYIHIHMCVCPKCCDELNHRITYLVHEDLCACHVMHHYTQYPAYIHTVYTSVNKILLILL